jgi:hypothetical protein
MARFDINPPKTFAVRIHELRRIVKKTGTDHTLAEKLWVATTEKLRSEHG